MSETKTDIYALDLFCGCGGMSKGISDSGIKIIAGIDIWDKAIENYNKNFNNEKKNRHQGLCRDLTKFPPEEFDKLFSNLKLDLICGGPPCQGFSIAGLRDSKDPRNSLFMEFVKYVNFYNPKMFIMENVMGILSAKTEKKENVIDIILSQFENNYICKVNKLYASDFEVPQNRRRVIIIGIRKDIMQIKEIKDIEEIEPVIKDINNRIPVSTVLLSREQIDKSYYLSKRALEGIKNKKNKSIEKGNGFGAQYLDFNKPSYTISARFWKDGYEALVKYSEEEVRRLTILELKRIQTFPDDFILEGSKKDVCMQIGNAVPCKLAYHLGLYVKDILSNV